MTQPKHTTENDILTTCPGTDEVLKATSSSDLLANKRYAPQSLGRVLVVGLGKSGQAVVKYCAPLLGSRVSALVVSAGKPTLAAKAFVAEYEGSDIDFRFEYEDIEGPFDLCIMSPGVAEISPLYASAKAASTEVVSELEFAWRESSTQSTWVAISGTNGKTTTTSLVEHICLDAGIRAHAVGNIGEVALACVAENPQDAYVAELSSFQLASSSKFSPDVAVLLGISPDHLYWHGSMERYIATKAKLFSHIGEPGARPRTAILDCTNDITAGIAEEIASRAGGDRVVRIVDASTFAATSDEDTSNIAGSRDGNLFVCFDDAIDCGTIDDLQIKGEHNVVNALAAAAASLALGASPESARASLASFAPLEHREEPCGVANGVTYINDSKATNVDSTCKAFTAFAPGSVICLLGGHDKGTDLAPLVDAAKKTCKAVICYGEAKDRFVDAFGGLTKEDAPADTLPRVLCAPGMREATRAAAQMAVAGDVVLLSPACSSFDEFSCFEERGKVFKDLVKTELGAHV